MAKKKFQFQLGFSMGNPTIKNSKDQLKINQTLILLGTSGKKIQREKHLYRISDASVIKEK